MTVIGASAMVPFSACKRIDSARPSTANEVSRDIYFTTLHEVARRIQSRDLSPVDLTRLMLDRIARVDPRLKSYATVTGDQALAEARAASQEIDAGHYRGPLHGVPIGIKDLCYTKGVRTMGGTAAWSAAAPRSSEFTMPMDLAGVPAICLPCGFAPEGVPYSIQFTGRRLSEGMLCRMAHAYEQATSWHDHHPNV